MQEACWIQMWSCPLWGLRCSGIPRRKVWVTIANATVELSGEAGLAQQSWASFALLKPCPCIWSSKEEVHTKKRRDLKTGFCVQGVRQGGGVETGNQLKYVTLTMWGGGAWTRLGWWEGGETENRPWREHPPFQLDVARSWSSVLPVTGWHCPPFWVLIISNCIHRSHSSLVKGLLPLGSVFLLLLHFLRSEL